MTEKTVYQQLAAAIGAEDSPTIPKIFKMVADENEAKVLLAAFPPGSAEELAEKTGLPADGGVCAPSPSCPVSRAGGPVAENEPSGGMPSNRRKILIVSLFLAVIAVRDRTGSEDISAYKGLAVRAPVVAVLLTIFLFSLVGLPPFAGFVGKFYIFAALISQGDAFCLTLAIMSVAMMPGRISKTRTPAGARRSA